MSLKPIEDRFWSKVSIPPDVSRCWVWLGGKTGGGYPQFSVKHRPVYAHRLAYELVFGPIAAGLCACHACDNGPGGCVNPFHIFLGTRADNSRDMVRKRRSTIGVRNPNARLSERQVSAIREMRGQGLTVREIARVIGANESTVGAVAAGRSWARGCS